MMIPINWGNNVDVQLALHFDLDPSMTAGQGHEILRFCEFRCLTGSRCVRFSSKTTWPNSPMLMPIPREQCRFATYTSYWPSPLHDHWWLQFCEFRLLPWHECWYMSGPYKFTGDRLDLVLILVNFSCELGQIRPDKTSYTLDEWFWTMFKPTPTWPNFDFGNFSCELGQIMTR